MAWISDTSRLYAEGFLEFLQVLVGVSIFMLGMEAWYRWKHKK